MPPCNGSSGQAPFLAQAYPVVVLLHDGADHTLVRNDYRTHWFSITLTQGVTYIFYTSAQHTSMQYTIEPFPCIRLLARVAGQRSHTTLKGSACSPCPIGPGNPLNPIRGRDWSLQLFSMNQEFPVSASHKLALITSLPFVHTARRYYRLDVLVRHLDWVRVVERLFCLGKTFKLERLEEVKVVTRFP